MHIRYIGILWGMMVITSGYAMEQFEVKEELQAKSSLYRRPCTLERSSQVVCPKNPTAKWHANAKKKGNSTPEVQERVRQCLLSKFDAHVHNN